MDNWLKLASETETERLEKNLRRLGQLNKDLHHLKLFCQQSHSGGWRALNMLMNSRLVRGRKHIHSKLRQGLLGENNQKIALDSPNRLSGIATEAMQLVQADIYDIEDQLRILEEKESQNA